MTGGGAGGGVEGGEGGGGWVNGPALSLRLSRPKSLSRNRLYPSSQGLTLVHFSSQLERFLWDRGCAQGSCSPCLGGVKGLFGVCRVYCVCQTRLKQS
jgi:hypothetical protein